ncbi:MAG: hypothetical protein MZW92_52110 [Comamonadaceae bacterium]|nr:hypothetical protein [Comamonadaceae bacterium]
MMDIAAAQWRFDRLGVAPPHRPAAETRRRCRGGRSARSGPCCRRAWSC